MQHCIYLVQFQPTPPSSHPLSTGIAKEGIHLSCSYPGKCAFEVQGASPEAKLWGPFAHEPSGIFWQNAQAGKGVALVPVPAISLGQDIEGGEAGLPLAQPLSLPGPPSLSSLSTAIRNLLPEGQSCLGPSMTLKV